jgi:hypothetical protein
LSICVGVQALASIQKICAGLRLLALASPTNTDPF